MPTRHPLHVRRAVAPIALLAFALHAIAACGSSAPAIDEPTRPLPLPRDAGVDADISGSLVLATVRPTLALAEEFDVEQAALTESGETFPPIDAVAIQQRFRARVDAGILGLIDHQGRAIRFVSEAANDSARKEADKLRAAMAGRDPMQDFPFTDVFIPVLVTWPVAGETLASTTRTFDRRGPMAALMPMLAEADVLRGGDTATGEVGLGTLWCARIRLHYPVELTASLSMIVKELLDVVITDGIVEHRNGAAWIRLPDAIKPERLRDGPLDIGALLRKSKLDPQRTLPLLATELGVR